MVSSDEAASPATDEDHPEVACDLRHLETKNISPSDPDQHHSEGLLQSRFKRSRHMPRQARAILGSQEALKNFKRPHPQSLDPRMFVESAARRWTGTMKTNEDSD